MGVDDVAHLITGHARLSKTEFAIFISLIWSLLPGIQLIRTYLSSLQLVLCLVAAVKRRPVYHYSADVWSFGIIEFIFNYLKIGFHFSRCMGA